MLNLFSSLSMRGRLAASWLALCAPVAVCAQDTIQSGSLRPLETLPSLGLPGAAPAPGASAAPGLMPDLGNPGAAQSPSLLIPPEGGAASPLAPAAGPVPGGLGTLGTETSLGALPTLGTTPGMPAMTVPAPSLAPIPAAALPAATNAVPTQAPMPASAPASAASATGQSAAPPPLPTGGAPVITAPLSQGYLYVEPYQTRFEAMFDAASMFAWLMPDTPVPETLAPEAQAELVEKAAGRAAGWCALTSSDQTLPASAVRVSVIKGLPGNTLPLGEKEPVAVNQAMLGFIWEFATSPAPADVTVTWNGWLPGRTTLPVRVFFGTQSETGEINSAVKTYRWRNQGRLPRPTPLAAVPALEQALPTRVPVGGIIWLLGGLVFYGYLKLKDHKLPGGSLPYVAVWLLGAVLMSQLLVIPVAVGIGPARPEVTEVAEAQRIVSPLLRNVYRAFDHRSESDVYDVLERSVEGELLRRLYLETIQALTLEGREGTRVNITEFQVTVDKVAPNPAGEGFIADCNWMARGNVGHWGHTHSRVNIYNARLTLVPVKDEWKLTGLEVQEVRRL